MRNPIVLLLFYTLIFIQRVVSWSDEPHMLISYIAYCNLNEDEREILDRIFAHSVDSNFNNIISGSTWPDHIKMQDPRRAHLPFPFERREILDIFNDWHYVATPYNPTREYINPKYLYGHLGKHNAAGISKHIYRTLVGIDKKPQYGSYYSYNFYLKYFIHLFADIHQPLHTITFFNNHLTRGDKGGNFVSISYRGLVGNIHYLCDSVFNTRRRRWPDVDLDYIKRESLSLMNYYPPRVFKGLLKMPRDKIEYIDTIVHDAYDLAIEYIYSKLPIRMISRRRVFPVNNSFVIQLKMVLNKQIVLAGYRLSYYLKDIISNIPNDL
ncbi:hypothetical protein, conserved [Plasmodium gonderi]|uniref:P1/s1 nuclease n=1 Tax=Plasmodium gonderi TaxID=77519 RepID=A0A1Y1JKQ1_PLAGO|nr:hypothetical protein, conserved [Plasmodium gonderi]GAW83096.1 hypothetical protein, conserved [Plasmodium gonderi]